MTEPDFRALCAEAAEHLSLLDDPPHQLVIALQEALAQPAPEPDPIAGFVASCKPLPDETQEVLTPEARWRLYEESPAPEPTFTDEEVEMHSAPWSYLNPAPKVPTDAELTALVRVFQAARNAKRSELRALPNPYREETASDLADHAGISAVLARWGQRNG